MSILRYPSLLSLCIALLLLGCSNSKNNAPKTLSLLIESNEGSLDVSEYNVLDNAFKSSQQQGGYQAHLIDKAGNILERVSFDMLEAPAAKNQSGDSRLYVALPLNPNLHRVELYKLDGSSGHFQLKSDDPLLDWKLPEAVKEKIETPQNR